MRKQAVICHDTRTHIYAIIGAIGGVFRDQFGDQTNYLLDIFGCTRHIVRPLHTEASHRFEPDMLALLGDVKPRSVLASRAVDDLVVDVGDV